ncbi:hypothetical protein Tco_0635644 [Tanacetum coccineum]
MSNIYGLCWEVLRQEEVELRSFQMCEFCFAKTSGSLVILYTADCILWDPSRGFFPISFVPLAVTSSMMRKRFLLDCGFQIYRMIEEKVVGCVFLMQHGRSKKLTGYDGEFVGYCADVEDAGHFADEGYDGSS